MRLTCGTALMMFGLLFMLLMIALPGFIMIVLGIGLLSNQMLRGIRLLAVLLALLILYKIISPSSFFAHSLRWTGIALVLLLYAVFALKLKPLLLKPFRHFLFRQSIGQSAQLLAKTPVKSSAHQFLNPDL
ncbi:MAG: hypothetical protein EOO69_01015 [Moraxellaceae bacterium]|nr:MAG: hypothetical protein EOO69_01015 [Moraxellaceae bacterium]